VSWEDDMMLKKECKRDTRNNVQKIRKPFCKGTVVAIGGRDRQSNIVNFVRWQEGDSHCRLPTTARMCKGYRNR